MKQPTTQTRGTRRQAALIATANGPDVCADIIAIARATRSRPAFFAEAFRAVAAAFSAPYAAIYVRLSSQLIQEDYHSGPTDPRFWKASLQEYLTEALARAGARARLLRARDGGAQVAMLSAPLFDASGSSIGAIALVTPVADDADATRRLALLESAARLMGYAAELPGGGGDPSTESPALSAALARAATFATPEQLAFNITNSLRNRVSCEQVALGLVVGRRVRILSVSGLDSPGAGSPGVIRIRAAMEECLDAGTPIVCQREGTWSSGRLSTGYWIHKQWHAAARGDAVASLPLRGGGGIQAVLSLRRRADQPFTNDELAEIRKRVEPVAPALWLIRDATRSLSRHAADSVRGALGRLLGPGHRRRKIAVAVAVAFVAWCAFGTIGYQLTVPCRVAPAQIRHVTVPFDGILVSAEAIDGDRVRRGDILCRLDQRELVQKRAETLARLAVLEREKDRAMAANEPVNVQLALANQELARAELAMLDMRIEQATIRAPLDGVVISGDLRKRIGSVVARGEPLFEVAPMGSWVLELEVPDRDAADVSPGMTGHFAPEARPEQAQAFRVTRCRLRTETRDHKNVFVVEARADLPFSWMRPGMEGSARIHTGRRPVWWVLSHRITDYLRLHWWL